MSIYVSLVEQEIWSTAKRIKSKRSHGDNGISMQVMKTSPVRIINLMLRTGCYPEKLKMSQTLYIKKVPTKLQIITDL